MAKPKKTAVDAEVQFVVDEDVNQSPDVELADGVLSDEQPEFDAVIESVPEVTEKTHTVKVHVLRDITNIYILGNRYTLREGDTVSLPEDVAVILRSDNTVI